MTGAGKRQEQSAGSKTRSAGASGPTGLLRGLDGVQAMARETGPARALPPVHLWNPPFCGDLPMLIRRDGTWHYQGSPIGRKRLVQLFSGILKKEGSDYFLVTPVEKCRIEVEDAPFLAVELRADGAGRDQCLALRTQVDDWVTVDEDHAIRVDLAPDTGEPSPYVHVRSGLEALIARSVFYALVDLGVEETVEGQAKFGVWSAGHFFPFVSAEALR